MYYYGSMYTPNELYHYGVKGMRWGIRRYENYDGTLTRQGVQRYSEAKNRLKSSNSRKDRRAIRKEMRKIRRQLKKDYEKETGRDTALTTYDRKKLLKNQNYLSDEEFDRRATRIKNIDYLGAKKVKQYSEAQKAAIHVAEKAAKTAITAAVAMGLVKIGKKKLMSDPRIQNILNYTQKMAERGSNTIDAGKKIVKSVADVSKNAVDTVTSAGKNAVNAVTTTAKTINTLSDKTERTARRMARAAERKGGAALAKKVYAMYIKKHGGS